MAALEERGIQPSAALRDPPELPLEIRIYWTAFLDLLTCRRIAGGPIPFSDIATYADRYKLGLEELKHLIWGLDDQLREHYRGDD